MSTRLTFVLVEDDGLWQIQAMFVGPVPAVGEVVELRGESWVVSEIERQPSELQPVKDEHYLVTVVPNPNPPRPRGRFRV